MLRLTKILFLLLTVFSSTLALAKPINLYDQPQQNAKVLGTIDPAAGIVPIFSPKDQTWMKVGDPQNGNVGWIKVSDLNNAATSSNGFTVTQKIVNNGNGHSSYIVQYGAPQPLTTEQSAKLAQHLKMEQEAIQKNVQQMMQDMYKSFDQLWVNYPIVMPVVVMPPQKPVPQKTFANPTPASTQPTPKK